MTGLPDLPVAPPDAARLQDEEIFCPICNYNLTGNTTGRCPECGSFFDRRTLIEAQKVSAENLIPWDSPLPIPLLTRWWRTVRICCVQPRRFAFAFGVQPRRSKAGQFMHLSLVLASAGVGTGAATAWSLESARLDDVLWAISLALGVLWGGTYGATITAAFAYWLILPHADGRRRFGPWFCIVRYASCHCLFVALLPAIVLPAIVLDRTGAGAMFVLVYTSLGLMCILLWAATLKAVLIVRCRRPELVSAARLVTIASGLAWPILAFIAQGFLAQVVLR